MGLKDYMPHFLMTLYFLALAVFIVFLQSLVSGGGVSALVFVFYEHLISTFLLSTLALLCERGKRPPFTLSVFPWVFLVGFLQIPLGQLLLTSSLAYIPASFQTTALNTGGAVTFLVAIIFGREVFQFYTITGQAKLWGIILSVVGATIMVLWSGPSFGSLSSLHDSSDILDRLIGGLMLMGSIFAGSSAGFLVEKLAMKYRSEISLSALMCICGTLQTAIIAGFTETTSAWKIDFRSGHEVQVILYGGTVVTGLGYYVQNWCIHKKGPVFVSALSPLLIVFSFILETLVLRKDAHLGSIVGATFVILGLYVLLWAKANDKEEMLSSNCSTAGSYEQLS